MGSKRPIWNLNSWLTFETSALNDPRMILKGTCTYECVISVHRSLMSPYDQLFLNYRKYRYKTNEEPISH